MDLKEPDYRTWGYSLGYALRNGMRHLYMLDGPEVEFVPEPMWQATADEMPYKLGALTFLGR